ncbi:MAG: YihY/virulence factor BrkB family protein, partial [Gemmatimonadetes bacterium]|nr:YihY/virulence factor BrkB family protein [Gemmatimonadota bacterium]
VLFFSVYFLAPTTRLEWHTALLVAFVVAVIFEISKVWFGVYLVQFATANRIISHANAIAVLLFVLWIYLTALLFLMGGEIANAVEEHRESRILNIEC